MLTLTFTWMLMLMLTIGIAVHNNAENDTPLCILGLVWVRVPIPFGYDLSVSYLPYSKRFMKFGWPEPPPHPGHKMIDFYDFSLVGVASDPGRKGPPL